MIKTTTRTTNNNNNISLDDIPSLLDCLKYVDNTTTEAAAAAGGGGGNPRSVYSATTKQMRIHALNMLAEILWKYGEIARLRILLDNKNIIQSLITMMWEDISDSKIQIASLALTYLLLSYTQYQKSCADMIVYESDSLCVTVLFAMQTHLSNKSIQLHSIGIFANLALSSSYNPNVVDGSLSGAILTVVNAMNYHSKSHEIQKLGLQALYYQCHLSLQSERNKRTLMECCGAGGGQQSSSSSLENNSGGNGGDCGGMDVVLAAIQTVKNLPVAMDWAQRLCGSIASPQDLEEAISHLSERTTTTSNDDVSSSNSDFILMEATFKVIASRYSTFDGSEELNKSIKLSADSSNLVAHNTDSSTPNNQSMLPTTTAKKNPNVEKGTSGSAESITQPPPDNDDILQSHEFDMWLRRVQQDFQALRQAPDEIRKNKRIVTEAVKQEGAALLFALGDLLEDKELVLLAVRNRGLALQFAGVNLRSDKEVVLAAVISNHNALKFANVELRQDRECLIAAGMFDYSDYDFERSRSTWSTTPRTTAAKVTARAAKRIALSTRFSLQPTSRSQATNFTYLFKRHEYIRTCNFHVYVPNAFNKKTCDPNWTNFDWPCRGTTETCKLLDSSHKACRPTDQSCWRYSFRCQLAAAQATGGFMLQLIERENSLERTHQVLGDGQKIEEDMANSVGTKIFQVYRPLQGIEGDMDDDIDAVEEPFDASDIEKVIAEIQRWYSDGCHDKNVCTIRLWHPIPGSPQSNRSTVSNNVRCSLIDSTYGTIPETEEDPDLHSQQDFISGIFDSAAGTIDSEFAIASEDAVANEQRSRVSVDANSTVASGGASVGYIPRPIQTLQRSHPSCSTDCAVAFEDGGLHHISRLSQLQGRSTVSGGIDHVLALKDAHGKKVPLPFQARQQNSGATDNDVAPKDTVIDGIPRPSHIDQRTRTSGATDCAVASYRPSQIIQERSITSGDTVSASEPIVLNMDTPRLNQIQHQRSRTIGATFASEEPGTIIPRPNHIKQRSRTTGTDCAVASDGSPRSDYNRTFHGSHPLSTQPQTQPLKVSEARKFPRLPKLFRKGSFGTWRSKSV